MATPVTSPERRSSASDILKNENFMLSKYSDNNWTELAEIVTLQKQFNSHFIVQKPEKKFHFKSAGVADHCVYRPLNMCIAQASNMIYPLCDNCRDTGWIACNSVLSGLYAKGITECHSIMMNLIMSITVGPELRVTVIEEIVAGFKACAEDANVEVTNSPLLTSIYIVIGGVATTICKVSDFMPCDEAIEGDTIILTKPLGTLLASQSTTEEFRNQFISLKEPRYKWIIEEAYKSALLCMKRSNKIASVLMKKYEAHAAIDLNGQSLYQSAHELAKIQKKRVEFQINLLPLIKHTKVIDECVESGLVKGISKELCGGLFICLPYDSAIEFVKEITRIEGFPCFYAGVVAGGQRRAKIKSDPQIMSIPIQPKADEE